MDAPCRTGVFCACSHGMGSRNPTKRDILEDRFSIRLAISGYLSRQVRRTAQGADHGVLGRHLYLSSTGHACRLACASPEATWHGPWPVRIVLRMDRSQEWFVRDALRSICGDAGYVLDATGRIAHLDMACVWDAHLLLRYVPRGGLSGDRTRERR